MPNHDLVVVNRYSTMNDRFTFFLSLTDTERVNYRKYIFLEKRNETWTGAFQTLETREESIHQSQESLGSSSTLDNCRSFSFMPPRSTDCLPMASNRCADRHDESQNDPLDVSRECHTKRVGRQFLFSLVL
jgi:hypothetical protein